MIDDDELEATAAEIDAVAKAAVVVLFGVPVVLAALAALAWRIMS